MIDLRLTARSLYCLTLLLTLSPPPRQNCLAQSIRRPAQGRTPIEFLDANRAQDGLRGAVSSVRTEVVRLSVKAGAIVEGRRALLELTRYDAAGKRIENKTYPVINATAGEETHTYDEGGRLVETITRDTQGAILRRTVYMYEHDAVGNWTKMTASVAISESGGARLVPREVTYRSIAYYDAAAGAAWPAASVAGRAAHSAKRQATSDVKDVSAGAQTAPASADADGDAIVVGPINEMALSLPPPSYPVEGRRLPAAIRITVEVIIAETGRVISARALNGPSKLRVAAEDAARVAIFSPFKVEMKPVKVKGLLVYDFPFGR